MNYSILMTAAVVLFAVFYYVVYANKVYTGPIVEVSPYASALEKAPAEKISLGTAI